MGGVLGKVPFGPAVSNPLVTGGRGILWLVPVMAVGLAAALQRVQDSIHLSGFPMALGIVACVGAAVTLGFALEATPLSYPFPGAKQAVSFVESHLGRNDSLLVASPAYSFAAESHFAPTFYGQSLWVSQASPQGSKIHAFTPISIE